jgi:Zn-dependent M32 family carboxypeptidase
MSNTWDDNMKDLLDLPQPDGVPDCVQDVHYWPDGGYIGYFPPLSAWRSPTTKAPERPGGPAPA